MVVYAIVLLGFGFQSMTKLVYYETLHIRTVGNRAKYQRRSPSIMLQIDSLFVSLRLCIDHTRFLGCTSRER